VTLAPFCLWEAAGRQAGSHTDARFARQIVGMVPARFGYPLIILIAALSPSASASELARHEQASTWKTSVVREPHEARQETASISGNVLTQPREPKPGAAPLPHELSGLASYYWQGQQTASGEPFNSSDLTAAHKTLPFGTRVKVTHLRNGRSVIVRINDRGPFRPGRVIDLSRAAAEALQMTGHGLARVQLEVVK
jgi:rare lipoprotein A (peptidoglycan hydrolase)